MSLSSLDLSLILCTVSLPLMPLISVVAKVHFLCRYFGHPLERWNLRFRRKLHSFVSRTYDAFYLLLISMPKFRSLIAWRAIQRLRDNHASQVSRSASKPAFASVSIPLQPSTHALSSSITVGDDKHDYPPNLSPRGVAIERDVHIHVTLDNSPLDEKHRIP